jgi:single-stranded-DNA-specific exonuclease
MEKRWVYQPAPDEMQIRALAKAINVNEGLARILVQRGITTYEEARTFFRPQLEHLHDPFFMKDMDKAVNRLNEALHAGEKILVYGDYDVDGTTSVALVYSFLKDLHEPIEFYIPDRYAEGYGISEEGVRWAGQHGFDLIIALDCGIRAVHQVALARTLGMDMIICDHHLPGDTLPDALAILDPKQGDCPYPYKELSGCGVGFKLLQAFCLQNSLPFENLLRYIDLLAVSIGSDIVPITGENRILAYYGLKKLNEDPLPGLKALSGMRKFDKELTISDVVFFIGPRINAAGRLAHARESVKLLINPENHMLADQAAFLDQRNNERKSYDRSITNEALDIIEKEFPNHSSSVLFKPEWHKGVIGIVASRCVEQYYRPTIILAASGDQATGSARSVEGFDIHDAIAQCSDLLDQFGGHKYAAGLSMPLENVDAFRNRFEEVVSERLLDEQRQPALHIDAIVDFDFIRFKTFNILRQMEPFGPHNMQPLFHTPQVFCKNPPRVLKDEHFKSILYQKGHPTGYDAIGFGLGDWAKIIEPFKPFHVVYCLDENEFQGNKTLQLIVKDIKIAR